MKKGFAKCIHERSIFNRRDYFWRNTIYRYFIEAITDYFARLRYFNKMILHYLVHLVKHTLLFFDFETIGPIVFIPASSVN